MHPCAHITTHIPIPSTHTHTHTHTQAAGCICMYAKCVVVKLHGDPNRAPLQATVMGLQLGDVVTHING